MQTSKDIIKKILTFLFTNWNGWKICLYILLFFYCSITFWFDERIVIVKEHYVKMEDYRVSAVDVTNGDNISYEIQDNTLFWIWNSADMFNELNDGTLYFIRSQGLRVPILGMFPKIIDIKPIHIKYTELKEVK